MAIDLDSIVAGSSSVDELVAALQGEQQGTQKAAGQIQQLADAAKGSMSPLDWLKDKMGVGGETYKAYLIRTQEKGEEAMTPQEWMKQEKSQSQQKSAPQPKKVQG